jgi:CheY-like chemotaxis protein
VKRQQHILPTHDHAPPKHVSSYYTESIYSNNITFYNASIFITLVLFQTSKMDINRTVLLVDDDQDDIDLLELAFRSNQNDHDFIEASNGEEALKTIEQLKKKGQLPCLIILDINMPKVDGRLAFVRLKSDAEINDIPIIIFSTSKNLLDQLFFEKQNAPYFVKPDNFQQFIDISIMMISHCVHNRK